MSSDQAEALERIKRESDDVLTVINASASELKRSRTAWPEDAAISGARSLTILANMFDHMWSIAYDSPPDDSEIIEALKEVRDLSVAVMDFRTKAVGQSDLLAKPKGSGKGPFVRDEAMARINAVLAAEVLSIVTGDDKGWDTAAQRLIEQGWANFQSLGIGLKQWRKDNFGRPAWAIYKAEFDRQLADYKKDYWTRRPAAMNEEAERLLKSIPKKK